MTRTMRLPWRKIAGALPALALIGGGAVLATTGGNPATDIVADSTPLVTVPSDPAGVPGGAGDPAAPRSALRRWPPRSTSRPACPRR